jgi:hypothetical protein
MQRTGIDASNLVTQFYSDLSFKDKLAQCINPSESPYGLLKGYLSYFDNIARMTKTQVVNIGMSD